MPATVEFSVGPSGRTLVGLMKDQSDAEAILQAIHATPTFTRGGVALTLGLPVWGMNDSGAGPGSQGPPYLPFVFWPIAEAVGRDEEVLADAPDGAFATSAGLTPALASAVLHNLVDETLLPPFDATTPKTLRQGWNVGPASIYYDGFPVKCNFASRISGWAGATGTDADGYPTGFDSRGYASAPVVAASSNVVNGQGLPNCPMTGTWTLRYKAPADYVSLAATAAGTTCALLPGSRTTAPDGTITDLYAVSATGPALSPNLDVATAAPGNIGLGIYPPGVPTDGSQVYHPAWLDRHAGAACLRFVTAIDFAGGGMVSRFAHFRRATHISDSMPTEAIGGAVTRIEPGTDATGWFTGYVPILATFAAPHGIEEGRRLAVNIPGNFATTSGDTVQIYFSQWVRVVDATHVLILAYPPGATSPGYVPALDGPHDTDGTWTITLNVNPGIAIEDAVARCNILGADCWICVPCGLDDAGVTQLYQLIASTLNPGLKCYVEYSNELWNNGYPGQDFCKYLGLSLGMGGLQAGVVRAGQVHALARAAWAAAGRPAADCVRVLGTQGGWDAITQGVLDQAAIQGMAFDALAVGPYIEAGAFGISDPGPIPAMAALDDEQRMDLCELYARFGGWENYVLPHEAIIAASTNPQAEIVGYEGGSEYGIGTGLLPEGVTLTDQQKTTHFSHMWVRHPRFRRIWLYLMQLMQDSGLTLWNIFQSTGTNEGYGGNPYVNWTVYPALTVEDGLGDGTDGLADNRIVGPDGLPYEDYRTLVSVMGGALATWRSLVAGAVAPPANAVRRLAAWVGRRRFPGRYR